MSDFNNIKNNNILIKNRFNQKMIIKDLYNNDVCKWILKEIMLLETEKDKESSYLKIVNDLPFFRYILSSIKGTIDKIILFYNIELNGRNVDIKNIFLSKIYKSTMNNEDKLLDDGFLNINILLSDTDEILFDDNIKYNQNTGDAIIYCNLLTKYKQTTYNNRYSFNIIIDFM